jgi:signal transduction histidine kinase
LVIGPNVGPLQYYSHLPIIAIAIGLVVFVLVNNRNLIGGVFSFTIISFVLWVFFDSIIWATNRGDVIMFMWSLQILIEPIVYIGCLYLLYLLLAAKEFSYKHILICSLLYLPLILTVPTQYVLSGFDLTSCLANETQFSYYSYVFEIIIVLWILIFATHSYIKAAKVSRGKIVILTLGIILFLAAFSWGNIIGSWTGDWDLAQYGLFGMPVFTFFLVYSVVRYQTFNTRLIGAVALVFALSALTFSLLFVSSIETLQPIAAVTFMLTVAFGGFLIRGVRREVQQRQQIERLAQELEINNERQEVLFHFIGHEVKGFLTKDAGAFASLSEGDFGPLPEGAKTLIDNALVESRNGAASVGNILKASNLKKGTVTYTKTTFDLKALVAAAVEKTKSSAEQKGVALTFTANDASYQLIGDAPQITDHVLRNLIDNALSYTPMGTIEVSLKKEGAKIIFAVKDSGIGITAGDKKMLFTEGGHGKDSQKVNAHSTGYGLYIAKQIVDAHGGTIRAESEGAGKGTTFVVEFPSVS